MAAPPSHNICVCCGDFYGHSNHGCTGCILPTYFADRMEVFRTLCKRYGINVLTNIIERYHKLGTSATEQWIDGKWEKYRESNLDDKTDGSYLVHTMLDYLENAKEGDTAAARIDDYMDKKMIRLITKYRSSSVPADAATPQVVITKYRSSSVAAHAATPQVEPATHQIAKRNLLSRAVELLLKSAKLLVPKVNDIQLPEEDIKLHHARLLERLELFNFEEHEVAGDGNCQFRALSFHLHHTDTMYDVVRKNVVEQLTNNREFYHGAIPEDYDEYLKEMNRNATWGDHVTLQAAADYYGVNIFLITSKPSLCCINVVPRVEMEDTTVYLGYYGEMHYNPLSQIEEPGQEVVTVADKLNPKPIPSRKANESFSAGEMVKLIKAADLFGVGMWTEIKQKVFADNCHRTPTDLKDKWRNLVAVAKGIKEKKGETVRVPADLLNMVKHLAAEHEEKLREEKLRREGELLQLKYKSSKEPETNKPKKPPSKEMKMNKPKKPPSSFLVFMEDFRVQYQESHRGSYASSVVTKAGGQIWKSYTEAEKTPYIVEADRRKQIYLKEMDLHNKQQIEPDEDEDEAEPIEPDENKGEPTLQADSVEKPDINDAPREEI